MVAVGAVTLSVAASALRPVWTAVGAWLNSMVTDEARYQRWPSPVAAIAVYLLALSALYFAVGWWSWRRLAAAGAVTAA